MKFKLVVFLIFVSTMPVDSFAQENTTDVILSEFEIEGIRDYAPSSSPSNLTVYKDRLYFSLESLSVFGGTTEIVALNKNNELLTIVDEEIFGGTYIDNPFDFVEDKVVYGTFDGLKATSLVDGSTTLLVPSTFVGSTPFVHSFFSFDNALYFKKYYREPPTTLCYWKTDGTLEGTVETDLCFKDEETTISEIVVSNNKLFIAVYDGLKYIIVTRDTDGTEIELPQRPASRSSFFRPYEGGAFFQTNRALYRSDGTIEGTVKVPLTDNIAKDSLTEVLRYKDKVLTLAGGSLYVSSDSQDTEIKIDLSSGNPVEEKYVKTASNLTVVGDTVYFFGKYVRIGTTQYIVRLLSTDGTQDGTKVVYSYPFLPINNTKIVASEGNKMIFSRYYSTNNVNGFEEIWVSDGTESGTKLISDIPIKKFGDGYAESANFNDRIFYTAQTEDSGLELWQTDGTLEGTFLSKDIGFDTKGLSARGAPEKTVSNEHYLYFIKSGYVDRNGALTKIDELWKTEVSTSISEKVSELNDDRNRNIKLTIAENGLYIWLFDGQSKYTTFDLLFFNFTTNELTTIRDDANTRQCEIYFGENVGDLFFYGTGGATDETKACQLWVTDGVSGDTRQLTSFIHEEDSQSFSLFFYLLDDKFYFKATGDYRDEGGSQKLYASDGTKEGTVEVFDATQFGIEPPEHVDQYYSVDSKIFVSSSSYNSTESTLWLWNDDQLTEIYSGEMINYSTFDEFQGQLLFTSSGKYLITNGEPDGTRIASFSGAGEILDGRYRNLTNEKYFIYRTRRIDGHKTLWYSDGTASGTQRVALPSGFENAQPFALVDDDLYATAKNEESDVVFTYRVNLPSGDITLLYQGEVSNLNTYVAANRVFMFGSSLPSAPIFKNFRSSHFILAKSEAGDMDNDGELDLTDAFPLHSQEQFDYDSDGLGDQNDLDDDNDGVPDHKDLEPQNAVVWADFDNDGEGDLLDLDDDGDGVSDWFDSYPFDASRSDNLGETENPAPAPAPAPTPVADDSGGSGGTIGFLMLFYVVIFSLYRRKNLRY